MEDAREAIEMLTKARKELMEVIPVITKERDDLSAEKGRLEEELKVVDERIGMIDTLLEEVAVPKLTSELDRGFQVKIELNAVKLEEGHIVKIPETCMAVSRVFGSYEMAMSIYMKLKECETWG